MKSYVFGDRRALCLNRQSCGTSCDNVSLNYVSSTDIF